MKTVKTAEILQNYAIIKYLENIDTTFLDLKFESRNIDNVIKSLTPNKVPHIDRINNSEAT